MERARDAGSEAEPGSGASADDRHPVARLGETLGRLPKYLVLARALVGDPTIARWRKAALAAGVAYLASPIDLVPGLIPVAGQLDDLAAVLLALRLALRGASSERAAAHLATAGLAPEDLSRDLAIVRGAAGWLARKAASTTAKLTATTARTAGRVAGAAARLGIAGARRLGGSRRAEIDPRPRDPKRPTD